MDRDHQTITGVHPVYEALVARRRSVERIHVARGLGTAKLQRLLDQAAAQGVPVQRESRAALDAMAPGVPHQGVVALVSGYRLVPLSQLFPSANPRVNSEPPLLVFLDGLQDPRNLGAVIRTAETVGATGVVLTQRRSAPLGPTVAKASAGAIEHMPIARVPNLASAIRSAKGAGFWIVGLDPEGETAWSDFDYSVPVAIVLGGEQKGIRPVIRKHCDARVRLPMRGRIDSLNVAVAAGIVLYEAMRQRSSADLSGSHARGRSSPGGGG